MSKVEANASMRQEHFLTLRDTIELIKQEAKDQGTTRHIARALDVIEMVLRSQEDRLKAMEAERKG